jgi:hypothetical protein
LGEETRADGEHAHERAFTLFDPVAGMRAMADIQAEGLRAAGALLERMLGSEPAVNGNRQASPDDDYAALVDSWTELTRRIIGGLAEAGQPGAVTVSLETSGVSQGVRLACDAANSDDVATEVWLHNGTSAAVGPLVMRCGELRNSDGKRLKGAKVRFKPRKVEPLPARSSRAVTVSLVAKDELRPGIYRGTIQAEGAPRLWLPLEVAIEPC